MAFNFIVSGVNVVGRKIKRAFRRLTDVPVTSRHEVIGANYAITGQNRWPTQGATVNSRREVFASNCIITRQTQNIHMSSVTLVSADMTASNGNMHISSSTRVICADGYTQIITGTMKRRLDNSDETIYNKKPKLAATCRICLGKLNFENPAPRKEVMSTQCGHLFCESCIVAVLEDDERCPTCLREQTPRDLHRLDL